MRNKLAVICNLLVPGAGLIVLRREWLGLVTALLFGSLANVALLGGLLLPAAMPSWLITGSLSLAVLVWLGAQWMLWGRLKLTARLGVGREIALLCTRAREAMARGQFAEAGDILTIALTIDDEHVDALCLWAELMTLTGRFPRARRAWRRIVQLDQHGDHGRQAMRALAELPAR